MKKLFQSVLVMLCLALTLTGCAGNGTASPKPGNEGQPTGEPVQGGTYVMRSHGDPNSFNPNMKTDDLQLPATYNIFNRLVKMTVDNHVVPDLATDWEFSEDGMELTFNLRENVKWHDGEPFTSNDVVWTFTKVLEEGYQSNTLNMIDSVTADGDYKAVFHLKPPDASVVSVLSWLGTWIMPAHLYEGTDWTQNEHNMHPIGTGPFKFVKYTPGVSIEMERNEDYWDGAPYLDKLIISIIPDASTAYQSYLNGEVDDMQSGVPTSDLQELIDDPEHYNVYQYVSSSRTYLSFNIGEDNPFHDVRVRQAVDLAVDRQAVLDKAAKGFGAVSEYYISPMYPWALNEDAKIPSRDVEAARKLIEDAGYTADANGIYFSCELTTFDSGDFKDSAIVIQDSLKQVGIDVKLNVLEMGAWMTKVIDDYNFDIALCSGGQGPDVSAIRNRVHSEGSLNLTKYNNPALDEALNEGVKVFSEEERAPYYKEAQQIMHDDVPIVILKDFTAVYPVKSYIHNSPFEPEMASLYGTYEMAKVWMDPQ